MRVAIVAEGTRGDVFPMLALGRSLSSAGHEVRLCAPEDFAQDVVQSGLEFVSLGMNAREFLVQTADAVHAGGVRFLQAVRRFGEQSAEL